MHKSTFAYVKATEDQLDTMEQSRRAAAMYANWIDENLDEGPDKTFIIRSLRTLAMWVNMAIVRHSDGEPRE